MKIFLYAVGTIILLLVVAAATIYFTGNTVKVIALFGPRHGWDLQLKAPAPDYADEKNWAALPSKPGLTADVPAGVEWSREEQPGRCLLHSSRPGT